MKKLFALLICLAALPVLAQDEDELILLQAAVAGGGSSPIWQDVATVAEADTTGTIGFNAMEWTPLVASQSGSATKARVYVHFRFGAADVKMALYDNSGNLITGASGTASSVGSAQYLEVTFGTPASVTSGTTYKLAWEADSGNLQNRYLNGSGTMTYDTFTYASFPPATLGTGSDVTRKYVVSLRIE